MFFRAFLAQIKKNILSIFRNKISFLLILLAPLFILFLVANLFLSYEFTSLKVGYVLTDDVNATSFVNILKEQKETTLYQFADVDTCVANVKYGAIKSCLEFRNTEDDKPKLVFHVDYSEMNLVYLIINHITNKFNDESSQMRLLVIEQMFSQMSKISEEFSKNSKNVKLMNLQISELQTALDNLSSSLDNKISFDMSFDLGSFEDTISEAKDDMSDFGNTNKKMYQDNVNSLDSFKESIIELRNVTIQEKKYLDNMYMSPVGEDCHSVDIFNAYDDYLNTGDVEYLKQKYMYCECYAEFEGSLENFSSDADDLIDIYDEMLLETERAKGSAYNTYMSIASTLDSQNSKFDSADKSIRTAKKQISKLANQADSINDDKEQLKDKLRDISNGVGASKKKLGELQFGFDKVNRELNKTLDFDVSNVNTPLQFSMKSIYEPKNKFIFYFPMLFFLLVMFISILFSTTFVNNEIKSLGRFRTNISPADFLVRELGTFVSLFLIVFVQGIILLMICKFLYQIDIFSSIIPILLILILGISIFVLLGMIIGYMIKKEEISILFSISVMVLLLFYSSFLKPIETINISYQYIIVNNPFVICIDLFRRVLFFNMQLTQYGSRMITLLLEIIALAAIYAFLVKLLKR
ncbi:MAG: ABC transporter permease [Candidatus Woesearchaeota archaeon]|jgi:ABC-2 type transport system permease protein